MHVIWQQCVILVPFNDAFICCNVISNTELHMQVYTCGRNHQGLSSQIITLNSQIFQVKNSNQQSFGLVAKASVFKTKQF